MNCLVWCYSIITIFFSMYRIREYWWLSPRHFPWIEFHFEVSIMLFVWYYIVKHIFCSRYGVSHLKSFYLVTHGSSFSVALFVYLCTFLSLSLKFWMKFWWYCIVYKLLCIITRVIFWWYRSFLDTQYTFRLSKLKLKLRSGLMTVIFRKVNYSLLFHGFRL